MMVCLEMDCPCDYHQILDHLTNERNEEARLLIQNLGNLRDAADELGMTLLHSSVAHHNIEVMQYLIDAGCNINVGNITGLTPLTTAIMRNFESITALLLKNNADIYVTDRRGVSAFEYAFSQCFQSLRVSLCQSSVRILEMLFDRVNRDYFEDEHKLTQLLMRASDSEKLIFIVFGSENLARLVIKLGYPIDCVVEKYSGCTVLHCAILFARIDKVKFLIEHGANVDVLDKNGDSPLSCYTKNFQDVDEKSEILEILLRRSTSLSVRNRFDLTDVDWLCKYGTKKTVRGLLLSGIDVDSYLSVSLLRHFVSNKNSDVIDLLTELNIKFDVNERSAQFETPLLNIAVDKGCLKTMQFLLEHGADVNFSSERCPPALTFATIYGMGSTDAEAGEIKKSKITEFLLQNGADAQIVVGDKQLVEHLSITCKDNSYTQVIIAHLAFLGSYDPPLLTDLTRDAIESGPLKSYFDLCALQVEEMKRLKVYGEMTIFTLFCEKENKLLAYARNSELMSGFNSAMQSLSHPDSYYVNTLVKRVSKAVNEAKFQEKCALVISSLTGIHADFYNVVIYHIISYLDRRDLNNLCTVLEVG